MWVASQSRKGQEGASEERACGESSGASWTDNHNLHRPITKCVVVRLASLLVSRVSSQEEEMVESRDEPGSSHHSCYLIPVPVFNQVKTFRESLQLFPSIFQK